MSDYADLTRFITEHIVTNKEVVAVQLVPRGRTTIIEVKVAEEDMGKVIGKGGRNIEAIRAVVRAAGLRKHERVQVELADGGRHA
ncbi:MAG TPA: KH domain-containing protein [Candidatus Dormibacteraeota bacterium]|nr:KH domain-containing protein [Candidatus Dormibacteraeota bacterium]